ncbi:hypothetical protein WN51_08704, partial [Melipona quadrifasciata]
IVLIKAYRWLSRSAGQSMPPTAVVGGRDIDGSTIYVGRAYHEGDMLPAKVIPDKNVAYVCHNGEEHPKHDFEVSKTPKTSAVLSSKSFIPLEIIETKSAKHKASTLAGLVVLAQGEFAWEFCSNGSVPSDAVIAGQTSDGEPLYVGRVLHNGAQTVGKVQPSHGCLYIPFDGEELSFKDYEVLVDVPSDVLSPYVERTVEEFQRGQYGGNMVEMVEEQQHGAGGGREEEEGKRVAVSSHPHPHDSNHRREFLEVWLNTKDLRWKKVIRHLDTKNLITHLSSSPQRA